MDTLQISGTQNTPDVLFNIDKGILYITGRSFPEHPDSVFGPIMENIDNVKTKSLHITIELDYVNTSSSKSLVEMLKKANAKYDLTVVWTYEDDDEDVKDLGEYLSDILDIEFEYRMFVV